MGSDRFHTAIIGGGQAGLAVSYHLGQHGCEHVILERNRVAERWRSQRWDALAFQFPNWTLQLPGYVYQGPDPDGFAPRDEVIRFLEDYATFIQAPLRCGTSVTALRQRPGSARFLIETDGGTIEAANVVIATGPYQCPAIPQALAAAMGSVFQIHSGQYRNPADLPPGAVLIVGTGASGCQIAEDLVPGGRRVYLAAGAHRPVPRRYRGRDFAFWEFALGEFDRTVEHRPPERVSPLLTGVNGGHDLNLRRLARDGVILLGHVVQGEDGRLSLASDLGATLLRGDEWHAQFTKAVDEHVRQNGLDAPEDEGTWDRPPEPREVSAPILKLDLRATGITSVIWASGFRYDFGWVQLSVFLVPVFLAAGAGQTSTPIHQRGITQIPGLYFVGLPWLSKRKSSLLAGVGEDAAFLADHLRTRA
jgi:putative flavoprotein involved in K+ transport